MKNKKGQAVGVAIFFLILFVLIVGAILLFGNNETKRIEDCKEETSGDELGIAKLQCKEQICGVNPNLDTSNPSFRDKRLIKCYEKVDEIIDE